MKPEQLEFKLTKIQTEQFATIPDVEIGEDITISAGINFGIEIETQRLLCNVSFNFESDSQKFIILKVICEFKVEENSFKKALDAEEKKYVFPVKFMQHLGVITVGTARGVLHAKTDGTEFNRYFLPTINLTEMVQEAVIFSAKD